MEYTIVQLNCFTYFELSPTFFDKSDHKFFLFLGVINCSSTKRWVILDNLF